MVEKNLKNGSTMYFISMPPVESDNGIVYNIDPKNIIGTVQLTHNTLNSSVISLIEEGKVNIVPYGNGIKNESGEITEFNLVGFTLVPNANECIKNE